MKKIVLSILLISMLVFTACGKAEQENTENNENSENSVSTELSNDLSVEVVEEQSSRILYNDSERGFEMSFPAYWGSVNSMPFTNDSLSLYSFDYPEKSVILKMIDTNKGNALETPETQKSYFLGQKEGIYYYILVDNLIGIIEGFDEEDQKALEADIETVIPTFKTF